MAWGLPTDPGMGRRAQEPRRERDAHRDPDRGESARWDRRRAERRLRAQGLEDDPKQADTAEHRRRNPGVRQPPHQEEENGQPCDLEERRGIHGAASADRPRPGELRRAAMAAARRETAEPRDREGRRKACERRRQVGAAALWSRPPRRGEKEAERHREHRVPKGGIEKHQRLGADDAGMEGGPSQMSQGRAEPESDDEAGAEARRRVPRHEAEHGDPEGSQPGEELKRRLVHVSLLASSERKCTIGARRDRSIQRSTCGQEPCWRCSTRSSASESSRSLLSRSDDRVTRKRAAPPRTSSAPHDV